MSVVVPFVPFGLVAFAGSRSSVPEWSVISSVQSVLSLGLPIAVGCQSGVDSLVRISVESLGGSLTVHHAFDSQYSHLPVRARFAARTVACVSSSACLVAFSLDCGCLGRGTGLAVSTAVNLGLPVFVGGSVCPSGSALPCGVSHRPSRWVAGTWVRASFGGVLGWSLVPSQPSLF